MVSSVMVISPQLNCGYITIIQVLRYRNTSTVYIWTCFNCFDIKTVYFFAPNPRWSITRVL
nr:MAG TPA: hypothetical protein [Caudoviricetes sp.]